MNEEMLSDEELKGLYKLIVGSPSLAFYYGDKVQGWSVRTIILECAKRFARL